MFPFLYTQTVTESQRLHTRPQGQAWGTTPFTPTLPNTGFPPCLTVLAMSVSSWDYVDPSQKNWSQFSQPSFLYALNSIEQCHKVLTESEFRKMFLPFDLFRGGGF